MDWLSHNEISLKNGSHSREACAYESAALTNPNRDVFIIFLSPFGLDMNYEKWPLSIRALMEYPNIYFRTVRLEDLFKNSILEKGFDKNQIYDPRFSEHLKVLSQILLAYRYGGTCLNTEYLILRNLHAVGYNWISDSEENIILDFRHYGLGHLIAHESLK